MSAGHRSERPEANEADTEAGSTRLLTGELLFILMTTALFGLPFSAFFLFPKFLATEFAAAPSTIGGLNAVTMFFSVLFMPVIGAQVDKRGRKPFGFAGAGLLSLASVGFLFVDSIGPLLWVLRAMQGVAFTLFYLALSTLTTDLAPARRLGQAIGLFGGVMIATNALGPAVAEWLAHEFGWSAVFIATAISGGLACLATVFVRERPHQHVAEAPTTMWALVQRSGMRRALVVAILAGCAMGTLFTFYQPWALSEGIPQVSVFLIAFAVTAMFVRFGLGGLADRLGRMRVATMSLFVYIGAPFSLLWVDTVGLLLPGALLGLSHGLFFPALNAVALDYAAVRERGKAMAAYHGAFNVGFAGSGYLMGFLAAAAGYPIVFCLAGICCLIGFGLLVSAPRSAASA